ncbi:MAG: phosphatidate cytidylyltransferase [Thermoanaerobaculia bacterium]
MQRLATALLMVPLALAALFLLDGPWFFVVTLLVFELAAWEMVTIARPWAGSAPIAALPLLVAAASVVLAPAVALGRELPEASALALALLLTVGAGVLVLLRRTPVAEGPPALGLLAFGTLYLALPVACLARVQRVDPWLVFLLLAVVWLGDTAAYYVGRRWGRRRLAPVVSPKKTWEGAAACLVTALASTLVWSLARGERFEGALLGLAALTSVAAQLGDLVESQFKRAAGRKDSGSALPGHGGWLDRVDAMAFAAPVWWVGLAALGELGGR